MLQYLRNLYKKYKTAYADEYRGISRPNVVRPTATRPLPNVDDPKLYDGDYDDTLGDYYDGLGLGDYAGYDDYDYDYYGGLAGVDIDYEDFEVDEKRDKRLKIDDKTA